MGLMEGSRRALMVGLLLLVTAVAFEAQAVATAMPAVAADLGQLDLYAWAFSAYMIPQIVATVLGGRLADRVGPMRPFWLGVGVFAVGIVLSATAQSMPLFLLGRFVQGFGGGLIGLSLMVVVGRAFAPSQVSRVMAWFSFAWMLPSFVGPSAAAAIVQVASWHWVFWSVLPVLALGIVVLVLALSGIRLPPVERADDAAPAPVWAALLLACGVAAIQAAGQTLSWWSIPLAAAGVAGLVFAVRPIMPSGWAPLGAGLPAIIAARALATGSFFGFIAFLPLMLSRLFGYGPEVGGWVLTVASLGWTSGSWLQSRPWLRLSRDRILAIGTGLVGLGLSAASAWTAVGTLPLPALVVSAVVAGIGMGMMTASTSILVMQISPTNELGHNTSALQVAESMGNALVVGVAGSIFAALSAWPSASFAVPSAFVAGCAVASIAFALRVGHYSNQASSSTAD